MKSKVLLFILILSSVLFANKTVTISTGEWEPWTGKDLKNKGIAIEIVTKIFKSQGYEPIVKFYNWKRAYMLAKIGRVDATAVWFKTKEREKDFLFSNEIFATQDVLIYKKGKKITFNTFDDLKKYKIILTKGYSYGPKIDEMVKKHQLKVHFVNSDLIGLKLIARRNKFDIFICAKSVAQDLIAKHFKKEKSIFEFYPKPTVRNPLYLLISRKCKNKEELLKAFNKGLKEFKEKGLIEKIINSYYNNN